MLRGRALATVSSPFDRGDGLVVNGLSSFSGGLEFVLGGYTLPVGADGLKVGVSASYVRYKLDASLLAYMQLSGGATAGTLYCLYPVVRSRNLNLFALVSFDVEHCNDKRFGATQKKTPNDFSISAPSDARDDLLSGGVNTYEVVVLHGNLKLPRGSLNDNPQYVRAGLPFNHVQGSQTSAAGVTFALTPTALAQGGGFGSGASGDFIQVQVGGAEGGFVTARPRGVGGDTAVMSLRGSVDVRPFYDNNGRITEIRVFCNGDAPRTPQEAGALAAVIALIEEARHARFEEAVRTENVSARLRSSVIAEIDAGRSATAGRESIRLPESCDVKTGTLRCE